MTRRVHVLIGVGLSLGMVLGTALAAEPETLRAAWAAIGGDDPRMSAAAARVQAADAALDAAQAARGSAVVVEAGVTQLDSAPAVHASLPPPLPCELRLPLQQVRARAYRGEGSWPIYTGGRLQPARPTSKRRGR